MISHTLQQGSPEWHAYRREMCNASDAPAMLGLSSYKTRNQLIAERATGVTPDVDAATQRRFDEGHRFEALARPLAENVIGQELYPVTGSLEGTNLSASFDGLTLLEDIAFEHKRMNQRLQAALSVPGCTGADLPVEYQIQMEQQCLVSGCEKILFMASNWDGDALIEELHCWYTPNLELRAKIVAGWEQFQKDVAAWVAPEAPAHKIVAEAVTALPAVFAKITGSIALKDNLPEYEVALRDFIDNRLIRKPETDQDFANLDLQIKALKGAEAALDASEEQALSQAEMLSAFKRQKDMLHKLTRDTRLAAEKQLDTRKEQIKLEQVQRGKAEFAEHIAALNASLGKPYMPVVPADFASAIKGKRTVDSLRGAVNDELARAKIAADEVARRIQINLGTLRELASKHAFLFADAATIVLKQPEDLTMLVKARIAEHQAAEAQRLEAERERIRQEEAAKLQREAEAKARAEAEHKVLIVEPESTVAAELAKPTQNVANIPLIRGELGVVDCAVRIVSVGARTGTPTLKLGQIGERLGFTLTADFLKGLGFEPAATDRASELYHESDFPMILAALVRHIEAIQVQAAA